MPLHKGTSFSLPTSRHQNDVLKRKQPMSLDEEGVASKKEDTVSSLTGSKDASKNRLIRSNDILVTSTLETLLDMLKGYAGIKDCSEEIQTHLNMVTVTFLNIYNKSFFLYMTADFVGDLFTH